MRAIKARGQKILMLYVTTLEEAAAADAAGTHMLSIESRFFTPDMREAAGRCFVQFGLPFGPYGGLATAEDYLRAAFKFTAIGGDCFYCAASLDIQKALCDNHMPVATHAGLVPNCITWTGRRAVGKTATEVRTVWDHVKPLEAIGCFGAELEVVPDRLGAAISAHTPMIMLGMGAGPGADAQYLFAEDVLGYKNGHKPRHATPRQDLSQLFGRICPPANRAYCGVP
jgi:3-methyl-2-oxobutanoate hydroxymethyltransferase